MIKAEKSDFYPDWSSAPSDTIADILEERHLSLAQFAQTFKRDHFRAGVVPFGPTGDSLQNRAKRSRSTIPGSA